MKDKSGGWAVRAVRIVKLNSAADKQGLAPEIIRSLYTLLACNMAGITGETSEEALSDESYERWKRDVFLGEAQQETSYLIAVSGSDLRGFLAYTFVKGSGDVYLNEVQIQPGDHRRAVPLRQLVLAFVGALADRPVATVRTYANRHNERSCHLLEKAGFAAVEETARGVQYAIAANALLARFRSQDAAAKSETGTSGKGGHPVSKHNRMHPLV